MACGCGDRCTCSVTAGTNITVTGSGDTISPYVISSVEATFAATNSDGAVDINPAGPAGHTPNFDINVSPDGGNLLSKHVNGLYVSSAGAIVAARFIGEIIHATGLTTPGLTLETDAGEHPVASYPLLANEYGATGVGDGVWDNHPQLGPPSAGNFRVPDLRDRQTIGIGSFAAAVGQTDGITEVSRTNTYGGQVVPGHDHTIPNHAHAISITTTNATDIVPTNAETGHLIDASGITKLNAATLTNNTDYSPNGGGAGVDFSKAQHTHDAVGATATDGGGGLTSTDGGFTTTSGVTPYAVVRKVVFAGA